MAAAEPVMMEPKIEAQRLQPGIAEARSDRGAVLPSQEQIQTIVVQTLPAWFVSPAEIPSPRPATVQFAALRDPRLQMISPIPLEVSVEDSSVIVCWSETSEFGTGNTMGEAIDDFARSLRELYNTLFAPNVSLGSDLERVKHAIERHVQPRA